MRLQGVMREGGERRAGSAGSVGLQISQVFTLGEVGALEGGGQRRDGILFRCFRRPLAAISGTGFIFGLPPPSSHEGQPHRAGALLSMAVPDTWHDTRTQRDL